MTQTRLLSALALLLVGGCSTLPAASPPVETTLAPEVAAWPAHRSVTGQDPAMEKRIATIIAGMTLEQKVGQMTQPDIRYITPDQVRQYYIGSILNGGGAWPRMDKYAPVAEWAALSDRYYKASMATDMKVPVPVIWGTDAVHGHNNVVGATLFPHNIGLGAAHDPDLVMRIGRATARAVRATGITWAFAPTLAVVQNERWGRSYESYSSDPALVRAYGKALVTGLQGRLDGPGDVLASAKHFIGDGGTFQGIDQGDTHAGLADLIATHAAGYYGALDAGVQTVMVSYSSWTDTDAGIAHGKMHANRTLITDVLKGRLGFDGLVVSDWNAVEQVPGCTKDHCAQAINAGIDMVMVPEDWKAFIANTVADVRAGTIPMARIDDAVSRILRVKLRSGLFEHSPGTGGYAGQAEAVEAPALAREAVRKSVVLLKNDHAVLPLARGRRILVVGSSADTMANQTGGWSVTWQATENVNSDYRAGETMLTALKQQLGAENIVYSPDGKGVDPSQFAAVIAVLGETPYAEMKGDVRFPAPLSHSSRFPADLDVLKRVSGRGAPVVSLLYSGRTVYANDLLNLSDAFIAGFLPGSEVVGIADLILRKADGSVDHDFAGTLPFAWPGSPCSTGDGPGSQVQFARGYGLRYSAPRALGRLPEPPAPAACPAP